jgi:uncharacterized protein
MKKKIFKWAKIIIIIYCLIGIGLYYFQEKIFFRPEVLAEDHPFRFDIPHKEVNLPFTRESNMNIVQFMPKDSVRKGVVLYFHGNRQNIERYAPRAPQFTKNNYEVWMIDYPGYGKSTGEFTEQNLYDWALVFYKLARAHYSKDSIIIYGRSLGSGIAAQLASVRDCKALILETPYYSFTSLAGTWFPIYPVGSIIKFKLPTYEYLKKVAAPVTILHGTGDGVIPYRNAKRLVPYLKKGDEFVTIEDGSHNNLAEFPKYGEKLDSLLR